MTTLEELLADIDEGGVRAKAARYKTILDQAGWKPIDVARHLNGSRTDDNKTEFNRRWDDVIYHLLFSEHLEPEYQAAVINGQFSLIDAAELTRVPADHRPALFAAFQAGDSRRAVRDLARELCPDARGPVPAY
jgi:hypothetical protein